MTDEYEIVFQIEPKCEKEIEKGRIPIDKYIDKIIRYSINFSENGSDSHINRIVPSIQEMLYFETTLFCVNLGKKERALITIDEDELFDKLIITLWAFTVNHDYDKVFRRIGESMYQRFLNQGDDE